MGRKKLDYPRGLSRVDHENSNVHLWRVQKPDASFIYFGDAKYGGCDEALRAALLQLEKTPLIGVKFSKSTRNTSGVIGVSPVRYKGKVVAFKAIAGSLHSKPQATTFPFVQWGEKAAWVMAVYARNEFVAEIERQELEARNKKIRVMLRKLGNMAER